MKSLALSLTLLFLTTTALQAVPVELGRQSFEGTGIPFTTSIPQFDDAALQFSDFFSVQPNNGTKLLGGTVPGGDGANMFAAEDIDQVVGNSPTQSLTTDPFSIAGKINTQVRILLAAPGSGTNQNEYDHSTTPSEIDFVRVEASLDNGPFTRLIQYSPTQPSTISLNSPLGLDSDGDGLANTATTDLLTASFRDFTLPIATGSNVRVRVVMHTNATREYICVDNIRIFGENSATAAPVLAGVPTTPLAYAEGAPATAVAPAITVTDTDSANITSASVVVSQNLVSGEDVLAATPSGAIVAGDIVYAAATGTLTITRSATKANYETVLRSVTYRNTNTASPSTLPRLVRFSVSDGTNPSNQPSREVQITDALAVQSLPYVESFETDGRGTRYALEGRFTNTPTSYFDRFQPSGLTGMDGTSAIVAEDTDTSAAPVKAVSCVVNGTGFGRLSAIVRLGAPGGAAYDTNDIIAIEASPGGLSGPWQTIGIFRSTSATNSPLALDTDNNGLGDGVTLSATVRDVSFTLPLAATLGVRVRCVSNTAGERLVVDKLSVLGLQNVNLAAYWDFNQPTANGIAVDSRAGLPAKILGGAVQTADAQGRSGLAGDRAMRFGTAAQRLHVAAPDGSYFTDVAAGDVMSVAFWIRQNTVRPQTAAWFVMPSAQGGDGRGFQAHTPWDDQKIYFDTAGCCGPTETRLEFQTSGVTWSNWHHVTLVKNGITKTIYLDGTALMTGTNSFSIAQAITDLFIGNAPGLTTAVDGDIDDFAVYGSALGASEVAEIMAGSPISLPTTPTDADGDTMPDKWETRFVANTGILTDPNADADNDGFSNGLELATGSNPTEANIRVVTTANNTGPGSLRAALAAVADRTGPDRITFSPTVFNGEAADTITLTSELAITDPALVVIDASGIATGVTLSGNGASRLLRTGVGTSVVVTRLTLQQGNGVGGDTPALYGGAIHNRGTLTLNDCTMRNCSSGPGGAIYNGNSGQTLTLNRCTLFNNTASHGGGIQNEATLVATQCTFANNTATTEGGAISSPFGSPVMLNHCTVSGNQATGSGGGGGFIGAAVTLNYSIVAGNQPNNFSVSPTITGNSLTTVDPVLLPLNFNGGPTPTMALMAASPARDAATGSTITTDQRGLAVVGTPDIGAFEQQPYIPIGGPQVFSEDFNSLPIADTPWTDLSLVTGWSAQINNATTPAGTFQASAGTAALSGLINCGVTGASDRSLGSKATGTGNFANIAYAATFQNVSLTPLKMTRLRYAQELWRSGTAAQSEKVTVFYAISAAPLTSILSGTSSATATAGAGFVALPTGANTSISNAAANTQLDGNLAANRSLVDFSLVAGNEPLIQPGQYFTLKWTDSNEGGTDGHQAIDDVLIDFATGSNIITLGTAAGAGGQPIQSSAIPTIFRQTGTNEITMDPGTGVFLTDPVTLTPGTEKCATLTVEVQDTSTGSGFEALDTLKVELLSFGPVNEVETMTYDFDINKDGVISGGASPLADEFNTEQKAVAIKWTSTFPLVGTIPATATSFQLRITGTIDGNVAGTSSEIYRFKNAVLVACIDTDNDGVFDAWEAAHGTSPTSAASVFRLGTISSNATTNTVNLPTVIGHTYQPLSTTDLTTWIRQGLPTAGDGTVKPVTTPVAVQRTYLRYLVTPLQTEQP